MMKTIISGGQTGVDRAALDWAIANDVQHAGWCPKGRRATDGPIALKYQLEETQSAGYRQRNKMNVAGSDGTLILNTGPLDGGTLATVRFAQSMKKPHQVCQLDEADMAALGAFVAQWLSREHIDVLNVAGPGEEKRPGIGRLVWTFFDCVKNSSQDKHHLQFRQDKDDFEHASGYLGIHKHKNPSRVDVIGKDGAVKSLVGPGLGTSPATPGEGIGQLDGLAGAEAQNTCIVCSAPAHADHPASDVRRLCAKHRKMRRSVDATLLSRTGAVITHSSSVLFLDFDGVTHPQPCFQEDVFCRLNLIEDVLLEFPAVDVVISSSWRDRYALEDLREFFSQKLRSRVVGVTPSIKNPSRDWLLGHDPHYDRQREIETWMKANQPRGTPWLAIDDRAHWFMPGCPNLLLTDSVSAFEPKHQTLLRAMLQERRWCTS